MRLLMLGKRRIECEPPEHRHDQQPPAAQQACRSVGKPRARRGRDEGEQQRGAHRVNPQIDDAPQMLPRPQADPFERAETEIVRAPEGTETFCIRSEEHTSDLKSLMRISYAVFCLKKKK